MSARANRRLRLFSAAANEVTIAHDWYEEQTSGLGAEFLRAIDATFQAVARAPAMFPVVDGRTRRALLRRFPYGVFFYETADEIVVQAVVHSRQHPRVWRSRS